MGFDTSRILAELEQSGIDMNVAQKGGGGDYMPPAAGPVQLRFFSYVELGKHETNFQGVKKTPDMVKIGFELSGPNHPPKEDGTPLTIFIDLNKSLNDKAQFFKLFAKMNHAGKAKHILALLGTAYLGTIHHRAYKRKDGSDGVAVELKAKGESYDIRPTSFIHPATGAVENIAVAPLRSAERVFLWDRPDMEQWATLFIEGEYPARTNDAGEVIKPASSKNVIQAQIMRAKNFAGSPMEVLLKANGKSLDIPDAEIPEVESEDNTPEPSKAPVQAAVPTGQAAADALAGVM